MDYLHRDKNVHIHMYILRRQYRRSVIKQGKREDKTIGEARKEKQIHFEKLWRRKWNQRLQKKT